MIKSRTLANLVKRTLNRLADKQKHAPVSLVSSTFPEAASLRCRAAKKINTFLITRALIVQKTRHPLAAQASRVNAR